MLTSLMSKYKVGFFILTVLLIIFCVWIITATINETSPLRLLQRISTFKDNKTANNYIIPVSFYEKQSWIKDIKPDSTDITALSENSNRIIIEFNQDMDTSYFRIIEQSIYSIETQPEYDMYWKNERMFTVQFSNSFKDGEFAILKLEFRNNDQYYFPVVVLNYE
jgi:hypothetical protein